MSEVAGYIDQIETGGGGGGGFNFLESATCAVGGLEEVEVNNYAMAQGSGFKGFASCSCDYKFKIKSDIEGDVTIEAENFETKQDYQTGTITAEKGKEYYFSSTGGASIKNGYIKITSNKPVYEYPDSPDQKINQVDYLYYEVVSA